MGTLRTVVDQALVLVRGSNQYIHAYKDPQVLGAVNEILHVIYQQLKTVRSNMVYAYQTISLVADTEQYTPATAFTAIKDDAFFIDDGTVPLYQVEEYQRVEYDPDNTTAQPEAFYLTEDGKVGFLPIPDDSYTAKMYYWKQPTLLTDVDNDNLPFFGIWDRVVQKLLEIWLKHGQDRPITIDSVLGSDYYRLALAETYQRGCQHYNINSGFFGIEGT